MTFWKLEIAEKKRMIYKDEGYGTLGNYTTLKIIFRSFL